VLVIGGVGADSILKCAEAFNLNTNAWSIVGSLTTERMNHTATLLTSTGQVLVAGGAGNSGVATASAELWT
jgi:hypothetical protein